MPGGGWCERAGGAGFLLCLWDFLGEDGGQRTPLPLPCLGKGERKRHPGQHKSHKEQVAELNPGAGGKHLGGI